MEKCRIDRRDSVWRLRQVGTVVALAAGSAAFGFLLGFFSQSVAIGVTGGVIFALISGVWAWRVHRSGEKSEDYTDFDEEKRAQAKRYGPLGDAKSRVTGLG
ncbi:hypothetical protein FHX48_002477 [Microbacterium halimionae]|uniref:Uncharacterized protein n=1 Tax=Microbacterium halimionae TaxID=1526413 RepID=A0A7W3PMN5_9MICO|nr:hypothetical protein [Microbacterium halimionae]MBA8817378.1 hypothetical protein [Microbacterium halimionae]NII96012.1 hypothetical protein [Microbacterium halimionae]